MFDFVTSLQHAVGFICVLLFALVLAVVVAAGMITDAIFQFQVMLNQHLQNLTEAMGRIASLEVKPVPPPVIHPMHNPAEQLKPSHICAVGDCREVRCKGSGYCIMHRPTV